MVQDIRSSSGQGECVFLTEFDASCATFDTDEWGVFPEIPAAVQELVNVFFEFLRSGDLDIESMMVELMLKQLEVESFVPPKIATIMQKVISHLPETFSSVITDSEFPAPSERLEDIQAIVKYVIDHFFEIISVAGFDLAISDKKLKTIAAVARYATITLWVFGITSIAVAGFAAKVICVALVQGVSYSTVLPVITVLFFAVIAHDLIQVARIVAMPTVTHISEIQDKRQVAQLFIAIDDIVVKRVAMLAETLFIAKILFIKRALLLPKEAQQWIQAKAIECANTFQREVESFARVFWQELLKKYPLVSQQIQEKFKEEVMKQAKRLSRRLSSEWGWLRQNEYFKFAEAAVRETLIEVLQRKSADLQGEVHEQPPQ